MSAKRKIECGSIPPAKHRYSLRSKSKCNQFELENFCLRFPILCDEILDQLNPQSLATCRGLSKFWYNQIDESRTYWIRKIQIYTSDFHQYKEDWAILEKKTSLKFLKELATALSVFRDLGKEDWKDYTTSIPMLKLESEDQWSPLHIGAKFGLELFKEIALKFNNLNPANNNGETPLHSAAKCGHLDICKFILENLQENRNPADNVGFTPLHYAAILDNLETFKFIDTNVENLGNPQSGIAPYHCAIHLGKKEICQFIEKKYDIKTNSNAVVLSETAKIKINISHLKALEQNVMPLNKYTLFLSQEKVKMLEKKLAEYVKRLAENCTSRC